MSWDSHSLKISSETSTSEEFFPAAGTQGYQMIQICLLDLSKYFPELRYLAWQMLWRFVPDFKPMSVPKWLQGSSTAEHPMESSLWSATCYDFSLLSVPASPETLTGQYYFEMATTLRVLGVRKRFWYLELCTARDLLISGEFSGTWQLRRYPFSLRSHPAISLKIPFNS